MHAACHDSARYWQGGAKMGNGGEIFDSHSCGAEGFFAQEGSGEEKKIIFSLMSSRLFKEREFGDFLDFYPILFSPIILA